MKAGLEPTTTVYRSVAVPIVLSGRPSWYEFLKQRNEDASAEPEVFRSRFIGLLSGKGDFMFGF